MWRVAGQEVALRALNRAVREGVLSHAYLFSGPKSVGKRAAAVEMAAAINCLGEEPPCGECPSCRRVDAGVHPDVQVVGDELSQGGPAREIGVDTAREMQRWAGLLPFEGRYRVFITVECERLSTEAANSLLKVLEESPPHVVFILTSSLEDTLLPTIRSRCQRVPFKRLSSSEVAALLADRYGLAKEEAERIAGTSYGRPGWAITAAQQPEVLALREERMKEMAGLAQDGLLSRYKYAARLSREFHENRAEVYEVLDLMVEWWRDAMLGRLLEDPRTAAGRSDGPKGGASTLRGFISRVVETKRLLAENVNPQLALEALMLEMPHLGGPPESRP